MGNLICSEFYRISRSEWCRLLLLMAAIVGIVLSFSLGFRNQQQWYPGSDSLLKALGDDMIPGLCCSFLLAFFLGGDFENRTANHPFMAGYSRNAVVFSRFLTYVVASAIIIAVYPMTRCLTAVLRNGWGAPLPESLPLVCKAFSLCLVAMTAGVSEFTIFAFLFRSTGASMASGIVLTLSRVMIQNMVCPRNPAFARIYEKTPMILATKIARSNLTRISGNDCIQVIAISAAVIAASFAVCLLLSRKSDFN